MSQIPSSRDYLSAIAVSLCFLGSAAPASGIVSDIEDHSNIGRELAFECLRSDRQMACLAEKGFTCAAVGEPRRNSHSCYISIEGSCYRTRFQLKTNGWSSNEQLLMGECEDTHEPALQPGVRMRFDNTNAPDFVRFKLWLSDIFSEVIQSGDNRESWRLIAPGANANSDYEQLSTYFVSKSWQIRNQIHSEQVDLLCNDGQPRFNDSRLNETFNAFDDVMLETYADHFKTVREEFSDDDSFDLDAALDGYGPSFSVVILDTRESVDQLYEQAMIFCTTPLSMQFTTSEETIDATK